MGIDYSGLPFGKGSRKADKGRKDRKALQEARVDKGTVYARQLGLCYALGISLVCTRLMEDPHELIPVGAGGRRTSRNRVGLCRRCHDEAQGRVGGNRLVFDWPGKAEGVRPNADQPGNVRCFWKKMDSQDRGGCRMAATK